MKLTYILVPLGIILSIYFIYYFAFYRNWIYGCVGKITFKSFKVLYTLNSENWSLWQGYVEYSKRTRKGEFWETRVGGRLGFNQIDAIKYQIWRKRLSVQKERERNTQSFKEILNEFQNDINTYGKDLK